MSKPFQLPEKEESVEVLTEEENNHHLILYNDDVNTFEFVIETLVKVCNHDVIQAEQCAYIVHYTGKCSIKEGAYSKLEPMCTALLDRGLSASIE
jgi:ATP-dependent Clp protease adaptor protein ClpS